MITTIIFSKNRPLQLDLCLQSLKRFRTEWTAIVIYDCDEEYKDSYKSISDTYPEISFWPQSRSLFKDVKHAIEQSDDDYVCFMTDDSFFYRETPLINNHVLQQVEKLNLVGSISLRLGLNINKRRIIEDEEYTWGDDNLFWMGSEGIYKVSDTPLMIHNRTTHFVNSYWNYPLTLDGSIFNKTEILEYVAELCYLEPLKKWKQTPNELESGLQRYINLARPFIAFPEKSCVVNSPNNMVQNTAMYNKSGEFFPLNEKDLLDIFKTGVRIDLESLPETEVNCPHTVIDILQGLKT